MKPLIILLTMSLYTIAAEVNHAFLCDLAMVESGVDDAAVNESEGAHGRYQIRQCYLDDANQRLGTSYTLQDMHDPHKAEIVVRAYLMRYGESYERRTGQPATDEVLARIHNGGPLGAERDCTLPYLDKYRQLRDLKPEDVM